jgi:hypothetical protein
MLIAKLILSLMGLICQASPNSERGKDYYFQQIIIPTVGGYGLSMDGIPGPLSPTRYLRQYGVEDCVSPDTVQGRRTDADPPKHRHLQPVRLASIVAPN